MRIALSFANAEPLLTVPLIRCSLRRVVWYVFVLPQNTQMEVLADRTRISRMERCHYLGDDHSAPTPVFITLFSRIITLKEHCLPSPL
jgi:hypothetical protein